MSSELDNRGQRPSGRKVFWRSLEEKADPSRLHEAAQGSDVVKRHVAAEDLNGLGRRNFLTLSGAIGTLAGIEGCIRRPVEKIVPYTEAQPGIEPGIPAHFASVTERRGESLGLLVTSHEGRPTKVEGNPDHPTSLGSTDLWAQASVLDLYDPDRARQPSHQGAPKTTEEIDALFAEQVAAMQKSGGQGVRILATPANSPTYLRLRDAVQARFPKARFHTYAPLDDSAARAGAKIALGRDAVVNNRYDRAKVIVALDSDFLHSEAGATQATREFAQARRLDSAADEMNRLYAVEPALSVTGSNADHRLRVPASQVFAYLRALSAEVAKQGVAVGFSGALANAKPPEGVPQQWLQQVARELVAHQGSSLIVVGSRQPAAVHALAIALNGALGNNGRTVEFAEPVDPAEQDNAADLKALVADMNAGAIDTLFILGGNPAYDAPGDLAFASALEKVGTSICVSGYRHETAERCDYHVPRAHELESWGDQLSRGGVYGLQQPLIAPLWAGRSDLEVLALLAGEADPSGYAQVRQTAATRGLVDELSFTSALQRGLQHGGPRRVFGNLPVRDNEVTAAVSQWKAPEPPAPGRFELLFAPDNKLFDGRFANNTWLLEMPDPITRITWDNAALLSPGTAEKLGIENGDMIRITAGEASIDIVAWKQPGQAAASITLPIGWGRTAAGSNGNGTGFDVHPLRSADSPHFLVGAQVQKLGGKYPISQTQEHDIIDTSVSQESWYDGQTGARPNRPILVDATLDEYKETPNFGQWESPTPHTPPLWQRQDYSDGHQWGMVIDLTSCTGCSACVIACQAENNVPVVGKDQVARGREMHWLRIDRYYSGDVDEPDVAFQPIGCQHCEEAPCENVCPVNATSHSPEGLNDIAYNRCIGTRYCMNNCPYKVRRFNFLNFNLDIPETRQMQFNPNVSVRFRGVIEKCSYCVQRIQYAKIEARQEGRALQDGDIVTACQQACSAKAITFGDINDSSSAVSKARRVDRHYDLLADVGTHPRTRFLGKVRNPNPAMSRQEKQG